MNLAPLHCTQSSRRPTQAKALGQTLFVALSLPHHKTRRCTSSVGPKDLLVSCLSGRNSEKETPVCVYLLIHYTCTLLIQYITLIRKHSPHFSTCKMRRLADPEGPFSSKIVMLYLCRSLSFLICTICLRLPALINYSFNKYLKIPDHGLPP